MRAREFVSKNVKEDTTISIPISITIPGGEKDPVIIVPQSAPQANTDPVEKPTSPKIVRPVVASSRDVNPDNDPGDDNVMVPPLQQDIELDKAAAGKDSPVIDALTKDEDDEDDEDEDDEVDNRPLSYR